jgi:hypothetical protein
MHNEAAQQFEQNTLCPQGMPPAAVLPAARMRAEDAACELSEQISSPFMAQMLQRSPPAEITDREQAQQVASYCWILTQLYLALEQTGTAETAQVLSAVLEQQASSVGRMVAWGQQQPALLFGALTEWTPQLIEQDQGTTPVSARTPDWGCGVIVLDTMLKKAKTLDRSSASTPGIITTLTEQLEQSGGW